MTRTRFGLDADARRIVGRQLAGFDVEFVLIHKVAAKTGVQHVAVRRIGHDAMRIRLRRLDLLRRLHHAVWSDRIDRNLVAAIRRAKQKLPAAVGDDIRH